MKRLLTLCTLLALLLSGCAMTPMEQPIPVDSEGLTVHFIDVGQADSILLQCDGQSMLIDGGNKEDSDLVVAYLQEQGVTKLDYVVCTHAHEDHVGGLPAVLAVYETANLWCPVEEYDSKVFEDFLSYADQQALDLVCPDPGYVTNLGSTQITVLGPIKDDYDTNNSSIVLMADHYGVSFLFTGDAETQAEKDILEAGFDVSATVLKVGHHGSDTSTSYQWLREVDPAYGVISVGEGNTYGHPQELILSRLRDDDVEVLRTDLQGHIVCYTNGQTVEFETTRHAPLTNPTEADRIEPFIGNQNSKKFHLPTCSGLPEEKNQVEFRTYDDARAAGYTPCGNCLG